MVKSDHQKLNNLCQFAVKTPITSFLHLMKRIDRISDHHGRQHWCLVEPSCCHLVSKILLDFTLYRVSQPKQVQQLCALVLKSWTLQQCRPMKLCYSIRLYITQYSTPSKVWKIEWRKSEMKNPVRKMPELYG